MKITYERLNQIIEEEVVKFKQINEEDAAIGGTAIGGALTDDQKKDSGAISVAIQALLKTKSTSELLGIYNSLGGK